MSDLCVILVIEDKNHKKERVDEMLWITAKTIGTAYLIGTGIGYIINGNLWGILLLVVGLWIGMETWVLLRRYDKEHAA